jgi:hypothetical protein
MDVAGPPPPDGSVDNADLAIFQINLRPGNPSPRTSCGERVRVRGSVEKRLKSKDLRVGTLTLALSRG